MFVFDGIVANYTVAPELFPIDAIMEHLIETLLLRWGKIERLSLKKILRRVAVTYSEKE